MNKNGSCYSDSSTNPFLIGVGFSREASSQLVSFIICVL